MPGDFWPDELSVKQVETERLRRSKDEWVAQAAKMEAERDNLQREVERLTALLDIAMPAGEKALRADIDFHLSTIGRLTTENGKLRALLKEARQYVNDAGSYEEPGEHQAAAKIASRVRRGSCVNKAAHGQVTSSATAA